MIGKDKSEPLPSFPPFQDLDAKFMLCILTIIILILPPPKKKKIYNWFHSESLRKKNILVGWEGYEVLWTSCGGHHQLSPTLGPPVHQGRPSGPSPLAVSQGHRTRTNPNKDVRITVFPGKESWIWLNFKFYIYSGKTCFNICFLAFSLGQACYWPIPSLRHRKSHRDVSLQTSLKKFCFGHTHGRWKFLGQGSNLIKSELQLQPTPQLQQCKVLLCWDGDQTLASAATELLQLDP